LIDIKTGNVELADDTMTATQKLLDRFPESQTITAYWQAHSYQDFGIE
jgi:hypothetical protein